MQVLSIFNYNMNFKSAKRKEFAQKVVCTEKKRKKRVTISKCELFDAIKTGAQISDIAKQFKCSYSTLRSRMLNNGLIDEYNKVQASKDKMAEKYPEDKIRELIDQNKSINEIAFYFGCSISTIQKVLSKYNLVVNCEKPKNIILPEHITKQDLIRLIEIGLGVEEISVIYGCDVRLIREKLKEFELNPLNQGIESKRNNQKIVLPFLDLKRLIFEGKTISEMASIFTCSKTKIGNTIQDYGFSADYKSVQAERRSLFYLQKDDICKLINEGKTIKEMSEVFDCQESQVRKFINYYGLMRMYKIKQDIPVRKIYNLQSEDVIKLVKEGKTIKEMESILKCVYPTIKNKIVELGLIDEYTAIQGKNNVIKNEDLSTSVLRLLKERYSIEEMSRELEVTTARIRKKLRELDVYEDYQRVQLSRKNTKIPIKELQEKVKEGADIGEMARYFNTSPNIIRDRLYSYKLIIEYNKIKHDK